MKTQDVDLSKLKAGDTVHFRCGGKEVVKKVTLWKDKDGQTYILRIESSPYTLEYWGCGSYFSDPHPLDIIRVEPAFRWEDVRPGMAFFDYARDILFYIGPDFEGGAVFSLEMSVSDETTWFVNKEDLKDLTPAPEHNIEVAK